MKKTVVVGASSGIGRYLCDRWQATGYRRGDTLATFDGAEIIVFCAAKARFETPSNELFAAIQDNLLLLEKISALPHKRFVFFSSADVYPKNGQKHSEDEDIKIETLSGGYPCFKLMSEAIVHERTKKPLVLRPTSLFGPGMRPNNITRLLSGAAQQPTLTAHSQFNCVTYDMVADLIETAINSEIDGIFNCAAAMGVSLGDVGKLANYHGPYGEHTYQVAELDNQKAASIGPAFARSSLDILKSLDLSSI